MISEGLIKANEQFWQKQFPILERTFNLKKNFIGERTHLDYGCGLGYFAKFLSEKYSAKVHGVDINKEVIKKAKQLHKFQSLKFSTSPSKNYDSISINFVLHELSDPLKELNKLGNRLKQNGTLMIYDFRKTSKDKFKKNYNLNPDPTKGTFEEEYEEHNKWNLSEFEKMLKSAGFTTISLKPSQNYWLSYVGKKMRF